MRHAFIAMLLACAVAFGAHAARAPLPRDSVYQLQATLTDQSGHRFDLASRRGKPQLVAMFYTSCQYICPLIIDSAVGVEKRLAPVEKARLGVLLISLDPARDTPAVLLRTATQRHLDLARWTLAQSRADDVRSIAGVLGVRYRMLADGEFNHTSALLLLDADGRVLARTEKMGSVVDPGFLAAVRRVLATR